MEPLFALGEFQKPHQTPLNFLIANAFLCEMVKAEQIDANFNYNNHQSGFKKKIERT